MQLVYDLHGVSKILLVLTQESVDIFTVEL